MATESAQGEQQDANRRVKVYVLGGDGQWDDRGTGYVNCELIQEYDAPGFRVSAENTTDKDLLVTKIFEEEVFQRQGDTIVTWTNPETREDVALSFQEAKGAQQAPLPPLPRLCAQNAPATSAQQCLKWPATPQVWEIICQVQGRRRATTSTKTPTRAARTACASTGTTISATSRRAPCPADPAPRVALRTRRFVEGFVGRAGAGDGAAPCSRGGPARRRCPCCRLFCCTLLARARCANASSGSAGQDAAGSAGEHLPKAGILEY